MIHLFIIGCGIGLMFVMLFALPVMFYRFLFDVWRLKTGRTLKYYTQYNVKKP